jgi:HAD superfamily hydrolase (TIGR01509 family)
MFKAILWDVDGTLAETEREGHLVAFNQAFAALRLPWRWSDERYGELLAVAGGRERLMRDMQFQKCAPADPQVREALAERVHHLKNEYYARIVAGGRLPLRDGVRELMEDCLRARIRMGIVTTTTRSNAQVLLETHFGKDWESRFAVVVCADEAPNKKPDPQAYLLALAALRMGSRDAIALEDAPAGASAAQAAGIPVIVTRSHYFAAARFQAALAIGPSLGELTGWDPPADRQHQRIGLNQIRRWCSRKERARPTASK